MFENTAWHRSLLDRNITWDEAITNTDGMKVVGLERPLVVNKPVGP